MAGIVQAQTPYYTLPPKAPSSSKNRFSLGYRVGLNIGVTFEDIGGFSSVNTAKMTPNGDPYNYDNGYVYRDISGSSDDTWYWGRDSGTDSSVILNRSTADTTDKTFDELRESPELAWWHSVGLAGNGHWGWVAAFNYTHIQDRAHGRMNLSGRQQTDTYSPLAPPAPEAPYFGTFEGPLPGGPSRPLISLTPTASSSIPTTATYSGSHEYEADLFGFRWGPYIVVPLSRRLSLDMSAGLSLGLVRSDYEFDETVTLLPAGTNTRSGSSSETDFRIGAFASVELWQMIGRDLGLFLGTQYQYLGVSTHRVAGKEATLDLRASFFISAGIGYAF